MQVECNWNNPGMAPYRQHGIGHVTKALNNYPFSDSVKNELLQKVRSMRNDATVFITKDDIHAAFGTASNLRDMHFRNGMCKGNIDRTSWKYSNSQAALVYCHEEFCIAIPTICGNVSRIDYTPTPGKESLIRSFSVDTHKVPEPNMLLTTFLIAGFVMGRKK